MSRFVILGLLIGAVAALSGCATRDYVHEYVDRQLKPVHARIEANEAAAQEAARRSEERIARQDERIAQAEAGIETLRTSVQAAIYRATAAGKLAEGKLVHEVVLTDDQLRFGPGRTTLSKVGQALLDDFATRLKAENQNVYIEIQGHTDSRGGEAENLRIGQQRAESVRNYLYRSGGIPLHRMAVISYGESQPIADNRYRDGRERNRRVVLVVLK